MTTIDYGPQTPQVEALIVRIGTMTDDETTRLVAARDATRNARGAAWGTARDATRNARGAAWDAARDAAWYAALNALDAARFDAWCAARDAALALVVRDLITTDDYDTLTTPWRKVVGRIHPDDPDLQEATP